MIYPSDRRGIWWLPSDPSNMVPGSLSYSPERGVNLDLSGILQANRHPLTLDVHDIVLGIVDGSIPVTLHRVTARNTKFDWPSRQDLHVQWAFIGCHCDTSSDLLFDRARAQYSHLTDWVRKPPFKETLEHGASGERARYVVEYVRPASLTARVRGATLTIDHVFLQDTDSLRDVSLQQLAVVDVVPDTPQRHDALLRQYVRPMQDLLTLSMDRCNALTNVELRLCNDDKRQHADPWWNERIQLYFQPIFMEDIRDSKKFFAPAPEHIVFALWDIEKRFEITINRWIDLSEELDSVFKTYFSLKYQESAGFVYQEQKFIAVCQAIESYHRRAVQYTPMSKSEFRTLTRGIYRKLSKEESNWIKPTLMYANEYSMKSRLQQLLEKESVIMNPLISDRDRFMKSVVDTRNYLTHYTRTSKSIILSGAEMHSAFVLLEFLLVACFLDELDKPRGVLPGLLRRNDRYAQTARVAGNDVRTYLEAPYSGSHSS